VEHDLVVDGQDVGGGGREVCSGSRFHGECSG
jgi:hypothetical protein